MSSSNKPQGPVITNRLRRQQSIIVPGAGSFGMRFKPKDIAFIPVPIDHVPSPDAKPWRVILKFGAPSPKSILGLDIYVDVVLGRSAQKGNDPDIDLSELDALGLGVSRRHALLRPARNKLFIIDLDSTNGTTVNAVPVGKGMAQALNNGDMVALGGVTFSVEIIQSPKTESDTAPTAQAEASQDGLKIVPTVVEKASPARLSLGHPSREPQEGDETIPPGQMQAVVPGEVDPDVQAEPDQVEKGGIDETIRPGQVQAVTPEQAAADAQAKLAQVEKGGVDETIRPGQMRAVTPGQANADVQDKKSEARKESNHSDKTET